MRERDPIIEVVGHSRYSVSQLIRMRMESDAPDRVLEVLRPYDGKPVTTRLEKVLNEKAPGGPWRVRRAYGMTNLENEVYTKSQGDSRDGMSLLLFHSELAQPLDLARMVDNNSSYFSARIERNKRREQALADPAALDAMAKAMNRVETALKLLVTATAEFKQLTEYGQIFEPDRYDLERECGLREPDKR